MKTLFTFITAILIASPVFAANNPVVPCNSGQMPYYSSTGTVLACLTVGSGLNISGATITSSGGGSSAFNSLTTGTNTSAAMGVGTGASLFPTGTGTVSANLIGGAPFVVQGLQTCTTDGTKAASNHTILQAALTAGGNVYIPVAGTYCNSATLSIPSNTHFYSVPGVTIMNIAAVNSSVIRNASWAAATAGVVGGGDSYMVVENIAFDGNKANQTVAYDTVDFEGVNYVWLNNITATGSLRTGTFPTVSQEGEGIMFRASQYFWVNHSYSHDNSYDGFKTRESYDGHFINDIAVNNGRAGIQLAHYGADTFAVSNPSKRIEVNGFTTISATGVPSASSPTVSAIYFHGATDSTATNIQAYGIQNCIGLDDGANDNVISGVMCQTQNQSGTKGVIEITPSQSVASTDTDNIISDVNIKPISGAAQIIMTTNSHTSGNAFRNIRFDIGGGSGTWTYSNAGASNVYSDIFFSNSPTFSDTGSSTIMLNAYQGSGTKVQLSTGTTTTNDCVKFDANGNTVDAGSACGSGGSVSVTAGSPDVVINPTPGTGTFTVGLTNLINAQGTAASYTIVAGDMGKTVTHSKGTSVAVSLPQATTTGFGAGASYSEVNTGAGAVTITPTTSTINGQSTLVLNQYHGAYIISDGTNYIAFLGASTASATGTVNSGTAGQMTYYSSSGTAVSGNANANISAGALTLGQATSVLGSLVLSGSTSGTTTLNPNVAASGTLTLPAATDTLVGKATTDTLTNKTYDTAGTGNTFKINGTTISAVTGTGSAVLAASPALTGTATAQILNASKSVTAGVVALSVSGGAIATDASLGNTFVVTPTHSTATNMSAPTNPTDGQKIIYKLAQDGTGSGTITWNAIFDFGTSGAPTLTTTASKHDLVGFIYDATAVKWNYTGSQLGFAN